MPVTHSTPPSPVGETQGSGVCILLDSITVGQHEQEQMVKARHTLLWADKIGAGRHSASVTH